MEMSVEPITRAIEREYRGIVEDNRRWERFVPRPGDIFVCTPPKCGTTWMQTIVSTLLFPDGASAPVMELAPWLDSRLEPLDEVIARLEAQTHRRSIKTHTPADGIPWYPSASYIVVGRDGRDAFMSLLNHSRSLKPERFLGLLTSALAEGIALGNARPPPAELHDFFTWFVDEKPSWFEHVASFWPHRAEPNVLFTHYNDLQADLEGQMRRVAAFLGIGIDERRWPAQVESCTFESMKKRSGEIADFDAHFVGGADAFLYKGNNGRWREVLDADELGRFERRAHELLPSEAIAWTMLGGPVPLSGNCACQ
jgi:aryl sulfotransferase